MNPTSMNLGNLLGSLIGGPVSSVLQASAKKVIVWTARQGEGKDKGDADLAANAEVVDAVSQAVGQAAATELGRHVANDQLAQALGVPTTEQGLAKVVQKAAGSHPTLDVSQQAALGEFLNAHLFSAFS